MTGPPVLDAHAHRWDLARRDQAWIPRNAPIRRTFTIADLCDAIATTPVAQVILVQVINNEDETREFLADSVAEECIAGVIGWTDLAAPDLADRLEELGASGTLCGIRHQALAEADPAAWLARPDVRRGLAEVGRRGLAFDFMIGPAHFDAAIAVVRANPSLRFVLDHLGKAPVAAGLLEPWATDLRRLAAEPNTAAKLSGLMTMANIDSWTFADLRPFTDVALEAFGPSRLMFGSDWPVSTPAATYRQSYEVAEAICQPLSDAEKAAVLGGTARALYKIG